MMTSAEPLDEVRRQFQDFLDGRGEPQPPTLAADIAVPKEVARALNTTEPGLAQMRYRGTGPKFCKVGRKILYRWSDIRAYLDANTLQRTDDSRGVPA